MTAKLNPKKEHSRDKQAIKQGPDQRQVTIRDARYVMDGLIIGLMIANFILLATG